MKKIKLNKKTLKQLNQLEMSAIQGGLQVVSSQATDMDATCCESKCGTALVPPGSDMIVHPGHVEFIFPNGYHTHTGGMLEDGITMIPPYHGPGE